ncbi:MAG: transposase [Alphaproteobacteria bacterium]|nr:transposase [Alphaproteobacteria bacterium]
MRDKGRTGTKKTIEKNEGQLFTFLNYDGVSWNNNNAEHAMRAFTRFSRHAARRKPPLISCGDWRFATSSRQSRRDQEGHRN